MHLEAGAKKVIVSAPMKDPADGTFCMGVNHELYDNDTMHVVSNASCTTNCLAPMVKVLNDAFGVESGLMTTIHSVTNDQRILDLPHRDLRRARSAMQNMIPTSTGAAKAVGLVIPELEGKLNGSAIRVPTVTGSITDLTCKLGKAVTVEDVIKAYEKAEKGNLKDILGVEHRPLVQNDFVGDSRSCIIDAPMLKVIDKTLVKVMGWYDNEWGYSTRMVELAAFIGDQL
jgi:glyceraldehyde 3-phosphate dehydrogenase